MAVRDVPKLRSHHIHASSEIQHALTLVEPYFGEKTFDCPVLGCYTTYQ